MSAKPLRWKRATGSGYAEHTHVTIADGLRVQLLVWGIEPDVIGLERLIGYEIYGGPEYQTQPAPRR